MKLYPEMNDEEKKEMWETVAYWMSLTEEERIELNFPIRQKDIYESLSIPESTFYYQLQNDEFMKKIVRICLTRAKKSIPKITKILEKNAEEGKEKSIEMYLKFVGDLADKIDHTTKGEKIGMTQEEKDKLNALLYGTYQQIGTGEDNKRDSTGENVSV